MTHQEAGNVVMLDCYGALMVAKSGSSGWRLSSVRDLFDRNIVIPVRIRLQLINI